MIYALDTNIISYILNGNAVLEKKLNAVISSGNNKIVIPLIVYYEARRGLLDNRAVRKMRSFDKLCVRLNVDSLTAADMDTAAVIYDNKKRAGTLIEDDDILIAAQCVTNKYILVTNNVKHFDGIDGLNFENWIA